MRDTQHNTFSKSPRRKAGVAAGDVVRPNPGLPAGTIRPVVILILLLFTAAPALAGSIRLHNVASVQGRDVRLADIAELTGERAEILADTVIARFNEGRSELTLRHAQVRKALDVHDVHWGLVSLRGHSSCTVRQRPDEPAADDREPRDEPAVASNVESEIDLNTAMTLRARIVEMIEQLSGAAREDLRIHFNDRDADRLDLSVVTHRFELEPGSTAGVGRVPVTVRQYRHGAVVEEFSITVDVERRVLALVARRTIGRGDAFTKDAVRVREVYLGSDRGQPLDDPDLVAGQHAAAVLREGAVVYPEHVRSPVLVRRGELVTVRALVGDLVVRTVGRASEEGARDEVIQVRNEGSRDTFYATVTGRREVVVQNNTDASNQ
ncbi:MAG: flagellar basal body P-ring formation chaperone FlgA [Phycisphaeraceae bacterium]